MFRNIKIQVIFHYNWWQNYFAGLVLTMEKPFFPRLGITYQPCTVHTKSQLGWLICCTYQYNIQPPPVTAKQQMVIIPWDQSEGGIDGYGGKDFEKRKVLKPERKMPRERSTSGPGVWRWKRAGWWWRIELTRNTKSGRKLVPQVRWGVAYRKEWFVILRRVNCYIQGSKITERYHMLYCCIYNCWTVQSPERELKYALLQCATFSTALE